MCTLTSSSRASGSQLSVLPDTPCHYTLTPPPALCSYCAAYEVPQANVNAHSSACKCRRLLRLAANVGSQVISGATIRHQRATLGRAQIIHATAQLCASVKAEDNAVCSPQAQSMLAFLGLGRFGCSSSKGGRASIGNRTFPDMWAQSRRSYRRLSQASLSS